MTKSLLLSAMFLLIANFAVSQNQLTISGRILTTDSIPLNSCTVLSISKGDSTEISHGITDDNGYFKINTQNNSILRISYIGFVGFQRSFDGSNDENIDLGVITMIEDTQTLGEIQVFGKMIKTTPEKTSVVLANSPITVGRTAKEVISMLPGVRLDQRKGLTVNGVEGCLVVVDGFMIELKGDDLYSYLSDIRGETIRSVDILRHPGAMYGGDVNGVIIIKTKRNSNSGWNLMAGVDTKFTTEGYNGLTPDISFSLSKNKLNLYGSMSYSTVGKNDNDDEYTTYNGAYSDVATSARLLTRQKNNKFSAKVGMVYDFNTKSSFGVEVDATGWRKKIQEDSYTEARNTDGIFEQMHSIYKMYDDLYNINAATYYNLIIGDKGSFLKLSFDVYKHANKSNESTDLYGQGGQALDDLAVKGNQNNDRMTLVGRVDHHFVASESSKFDFGVKFISTQMNNNIFYYKRENADWIEDIKNTHRTLYREDILALYTSYNLTYDRLSLNAGLRYEHTFDNNISANAQKQIVNALLPSVIFSYSLNESKSNILALSLHSGIKRPTFTDLSPYFKQINRYTQVSGNPELRPTQSYLVTMGFTLHNNYYIGLSGAFEENKIEWSAYSPSGDPLAALYMIRNIPKSRHIQLLANIPIVISKWWRMNLDLAGGYKINKYYTMADQSVWQYSARMNNQFSFAKFFDAEINASYLSSDLFGNEVMKPYFTVDFAIKRSIIKDKLQLAVYGNNVFRRALDVDITTDTFTKNLVMRNSMFCHNFGISLRYTLNGKAKSKIVDTGNSADKLR